MDQKVRFPLSSEDFFLVSHGFVKSWRSLCLCTSSIINTATVRSTTLRAVGAPICLISWRRMRRSSTRRCSWKKAAAAASTHTTRLRYGTDTLPAAVCLGRGPQGRRLEAGTDEGGWSMPWSVGLLRGGGTSWLALQPCRIGLNSQLQFG